MSVAPDTPKQRVKPVQKRSRLKIEAILDATARLLAERGLEAATMLAIAEQAALPPATVYHYFESRLAVFAALAERTMAQVDDELEQYIGQFAASGQVSAAALLKHLHEAYRQAPGYVQILQALRAEPALHHIISASNQRMAGVIASTLEQRARLGRERASRVAWIISEVCELVLQKALGSEAEEADAIMQELIEMLDVLFQHYVTSSIS